MDEDDVLIACAVFIIIANKYHANEDFGFDQVSKVESKTSRDNRVKKDK